MGINATMGTLLRLKCVADDLTRGTYGYQILYFGRRYILWESVMLSRSLRWFGLLHIYNLGLIIQNTTRVFIYIESRLKEHYLNSAETVPLDSKTLLKPEI